MRLTQNIIVNTLAVTLIVLTTVFLLAMSVPIRVLKDWRIETDSNLYNRNSTIIVESTSTKLRQATGKVSRVIECDTGRDSVTGYSLNLSQGSARVGNHTNTYRLKMPSNITNLPATCRGVVSVDYRVLWIRHVVENTVSNNFTVVE